MGTRGAWGFVLDGQTKITYNHNDSYPDGLGMDVARWLVAQLRKLGGLVELREQVRRLAPVPTDREPAPADFARLAEFHDPGVSTGRDWYSLLRHTQGNPAAMLRAGYYEPADDFPTDSLFCEYAYLVDLDADEGVGRFEVYEGFQKTPPQRGRWVGQRGIDPDGNPSCYAAVELVGSYSLPDVLAAGGVAPIEGPALLALTSGASSTAVDALAETDPTN
jgi:hypothetical protein